MVSRGVSAKEEGETMKLRIKGNSLRLRVSRSELNRFLGGERIADTVRFAPAPEAKLTYALLRGPAAPGAQVQYSGQEVTVLLSAQQTELWAQENEVGVYTSVDLGAEGALELIVEKDFACLDGSEEDNKDTFTNPLMGSTC
jgi:hypothetical protein